MPVKAEKILNISRPYYSVLGLDLKPGQFAEAENKTIVLRTHTLTNFRADLNIINIENGVGGYTDRTRFHVLDSFRVSFDTNSEGFVG